MKNARVAGGMVVPVFLLILFSCANTNKTNQQGDDTLKGEISISGAFALYPLTNKWVSEFVKSHPKVNINVSAGGAGKGMVDVLSGMVDLAMFSREVTPEETAKGAWYIAVSRDAVVPTINSKIPFIQQIKRQGMTKQQFSDIFITGKIKSWKQLFPDTEDRQIHVFVRSDACGAAEMWAKYLGKNQEDLNGIGVSGDPGIASAVKNDLYSIGFNNLNFAYDVHTRKVYEGLEVVPLDLNENGIIDENENFYASMDELIKAINEGAYPSPPARDLYFVSKGKPENPIVRAFLKWVLTEGQEFIREAGYARLHDEQVKNELKKLD